MNNLNYVWATSIERIKQECDRSKKEKENTQQI